MLSQLSFLILHVIQRNHNSILFANLNNFFFPSRNFLFNESVLFKLGLKKKKKTNPSFLISFCYCLGSDECRNQHKVSHRVTEKCIPTRKPQVSASELSRGRFSLGQIPGYPKWLFLLHPTVAGVMNEMV